MEKNKFSPADKYIIDSQISYIANRYANGRPMSVVRAEAERLANEALKKYDPKMGNLKTFLTGALQKMSRNAYKASIPIVVPEHRLLLKNKYRNFRDAHQEMYGYTPTAKEVSKAIKVPVKEIEKMMSEYGAVRAESAFSTQNIDGISMSDEDVIYNLPSHLQPIAKELYLNELTKNKVQKKLGISRTKLTRFKKDIDREIKRINQIRSVEYD